VEVEEPATVQCTRRDGRGVPPTYELGQEVRALLSVRDARELAELPLDEDT
jgi:hypothetical protein